MQKRSREEEVADQVLDRPMSPAEVNAARGVGLPRAMTRAINARLIKGPYHKQHGVDTLHISLAELSRVLGWSAEYENLIIDGWKALGWTVGYIDEWYKPVNGPYFYFQKK